MLGHPAPNLGLTLAGALCLTPAHALPCAREGKRRMLGYPALNLALIFTMGRCVWPTPAAMQGRDFQGLSFLGKPTLTGVSMAWWTQCQARRLGR